MVRMQNKARNAAQSAKGRVKETAGKVTGNKKRQAEGKADRAKAGVKKTAQKVRDKLR